MLGPCLPCSQQYRSFSGSPFPCVQHGESSSSRGRQPVNSLRSQIYSCVERGIRVKSYSVLILEKVGWDFSFFFCPVPSTPAKSAGERGHKNAHFGSLVFTGC